MGGRAARAPRLARPAAAAAELGAVFPGRIAAAVSSANSDVLVANWRRNCLAVTWRL